MRSLALVAALFLAGPAIAKKVPLDVESNKLTLKALTVHGQWIEVSKADFVVHLVVSNLGSVPLVIRHTDMTCGRGELPGILGFARFGIGERTLDLQLGEAKILQLVCEHPKGATGDFRISIGKVWSNPTGDGRTVAEVVISDAGWSLPEEKVQ